MTERADRVYKRKRIKCPDDESLYFDVPVIYQMKFKVDLEQAQENQLFHNNSSTSSRQVRVQRVNNVSDSSQYVNVERVKMFQIRDLITQAQDVQYYLVNDDPAPIQPDGSNSPAHQRVHYVRYYKNNDPQSECFGDMELIDEIRLVDANGQAWQYFLRWPELGATVNDPSVPYTVTVGYCDPDLPETTGE